MRIWRLLILPMCALTVAACGDSDDPTAGATTTSDVELAVEEPMYQEFVRHMEEVMKRVEPLPSPLQSVERWEDCGQGADPICDAVVILIDDAENDEAPIDALADALESKGWVLEQDGNIEVRYEHPDGGVALIEGLSDRDERGATGLFDRGFIEDHGADGIVYLALLPRP